MSFQEWQDSQDGEKQFEWGSSPKTRYSEVKHTKAQFKDMPEDIRRVYYTQYVHEQTSNQ